MEDSEEMREVDQADANGRAESGKLDIRDPGLGETANPSGVGVSAILLRQLGSVCGGRIRKRGGEFLLVLGGLGSRRQSRRGDWLCHDDLMSLGCLVQASVCYV